MKDPFWKIKSLSEMTPYEWESLCDRCGICCLEKIEDRDTGDILLTSVSCEYLDIASCRCRIYDKRLSANPECTAISPVNPKKVPGLPDTCAYRCVAEGRELPGWHPLVSGNPDTVHQAGVSIRDRVISGRYVHPDDIAKHIIPQGRSSCR